MFSSTSKTSDSERAEVKRLLKQDIEDLKKAIVEHVSEMKTELIQQGYDEEEAGELLKEVAAEAEVTIIKRFKEELKQKLQEKVKARMAATTTPPTCGK